MRWKRFFFIYSLSIHSYIRFKKRCIGNRVIFAFLPLFLALLVTVSAAPIFDIQLLPTNVGEVLLNETSAATTESMTYDDNDDDDDDDDSNDSDDEDNQSTTIDYHEETTNTQELITDGHLFIGITDMPLNIDEILQLSGVLHDQAQ